MAGHPQPDAQRKDEVEADDDDVEAMQTNLVYVKEAVRKA
jgi:hypothetical protein